MQRLHHTIRVEESRAHVRVLVLDRPQVANAINTQMARELLELFTELTARPGDLRCLVITGAGEGAFCAGGDLKERHEMSAADWSAQHAIMERTIVSILQCPVPVIAAVNGAAFGGGCEIALAADFIYAAASARFALTETRLGIIPGAGGTQTLPRAVGTRRAMELICTAMPFSADEALSWGLVNGVVPREGLLEKTLGVAERIAANAPLAVKQAKKSVRAGMQMDIHHGLEFAIEAYNMLIATEDRREGVRAFVEKRTPAFTGT
ncbi:MAG: enoyl-CoA hydratase/isomerase family protein [Proteobacteria bacterium]|nr:enoyl-CoA hydratase/isomerase family protein [Pseudomonadota bacterium]